MSLSPNDRQRILPRSSRYVCDLRKRWRLWTCSRLCPLLWRRIGFPSRTPRPGWGLRRLDRCWQGGCTLDVRRHPQCDSLKSCADVHEEGGCQPDGVDDTARHDIAQGSDEPRPDPAREQHEDDCKEYCRPCHLMRRCPRHDVEAVEDGLLCLERHLSACRSCCLQQELQLRRQASRGSPASCRCLFSFAVQAD